MLGDQGWKKVPSCLHLTPELIPTWVQHALAPCLPPVHSIQIILKSTSVMLQCPVLSLGLNHDIQAHVDCSAWDLQAA